MSDYDNTNSGVLFLNQKKTKDTQPDRNGGLNIGGVDFRASAWAGVDRKTGLYGYKVLFSTATEKYEDSKDVGQGMLMTNSDKTTEKQPDFKGEATINGEPVKFAGWSRLSTKGIDMISLKVDKPMENGSGGDFQRVSEVPLQAQGDELAGSGQAAPASVMDLDDDIPF